MCKQRVSVFFFSRSCIVCWIPCRSGNDSWRWQWNCCVINADNAFRVLLSCCQMKLIAGSFQVRAHTAFNVRLIICTLYLYLYLISFCFSRFSNVFRILIKCLFLCFSPLINSWWSALQKAMHRKPFLALPFFAVHKIKRRCHNAHSEYLYL